MFSVKIRFFLYDSHLHNLHGDKVNNLWEIYFKTEILPLRKPRDIPSDIYRDIFAFKFIFNNTLHLLWHHNIYLFPNKKYTIRWFLAFFFLPSSIQFLCPHQI